MEKEIRTFIAIDLPADVREQLRQFQTELKNIASTADGVRWAKPEGMHITLKFLGEITPAQVEAVINGTKRACQSQSSFQLSLEGLGGFPNLKRPRVLWMGITGDITPLTQLAKQIEFEMQNAGFPKENRPFRPHLTLSRIKNMQGIQPLLHHFEKETFGSEVFSINEVLVMKSQLHPQGAKYTALETIHF